MTLYFDTKVQFLDSDAISTIGVWHQNESIFAVASYSQNRGGSVTIFDDLVSLGIKKNQTKKKISIKITGGTTARYLIPSSSNISSNCFGLASGKTSSSFWLGEWRSSRLVQWKS